MALVYEFMVNGNLDEWLHPCIVATNRVQEGFKILNLIQRINIAIDVASAIQYLHHHSGTPIVHCDLKPSNVLLDDEMTAHIGDFGLAKFLPHSMQNNFSNQSSFAGLRGTIGYAPPAKSFMAECEALRNIKHRNLVKIVTACSSVDYQGNDFKALVYEFMVNGSLEEWLHPHVLVNRMHEGYKILNLIQRVNIAIDVASAIEYLHHHSGTSIVHCDLKPSNVLLDDAMTAHIGDFGLAKFLSYSIHNNFSNQSSSAGLRGTIGYAPPEYGLGSEVSKQGDVYSYGILLLEMFTRKRPTDDMFKEDWNLHEFVMSAFPNRVSTIVDPILIQEGGQSDDKITMECLISILGIGISYSVEAPTDRIDIGDATIKLCLIRDKLKISQGRNARLRNITHT
ncbi:hypothetical protein JCGZ_01290 [Jatropha curcas]|uniref:non-specific serine/threonine protein kinase n=1 Tax=Jatropha curcas TaxID=180498 RepID=A0A067LJH4_JATCU|nr:hypothetical protein JCGZ_01290 [Jatropha curcas]